MKEMGANAIRTSHNPPAPELVALCDRMGLMCNWSLWIVGIKGNGKSYNILFVIGMKRYAFVGSSLPESSVSDHVEYR